MTSLRKGGGLREDNGDGSESTKKQKQSRDSPTSRDKTRREPNAHGGRSKLSIEQCGCVPTSGRNTREVPPLKKSMRYVPHAYTPFHHISLDVMDGLTDDENAEVDFDQDQERDYIGDESTTILTPSYDTTSLSSTIPTYFDEADEFVSYSRSGDPCLNIAHDLKYMGHWAEMDGRLEILPSYMQAMGLNWGYRLCKDVRDAMVGIEVAFPSVEQTLMNVYGTERR